MSNKYFEIGLNASRNYIVDEAPGYICPTCLKIIRDVADLSEEHVQINNGVRLANMQIT